jgi:poly-gamma-glutamate synthesis protein (capsule biosynthesis protein)
MKLIFAGDILVTRSLRGALDRGVLDHLTAALHGGDAVFGNLETLLHTFATPPSAESGGTWLQADPVIAGELRELGFDAVARANNHALDYGVGALLTTSQALDRAGVKHAGAGLDLSQALRPAFVDSEHGRVALISACSTLPNGSHASRQRHSISGRPGVAPLRYRTTYTIPPDMFQPLRVVARRCYFDKGRTPDRVRVAGVVFEPGPDYAVVSVPDEEDVEAISEAVANARRVADVVVVSIHSQESEGDWERPAGFLQLACRAFAYAGASVVYGHGPHLLRGVEVHQGVPILYSLGSFAFQNDTVVRHPDDARRATSLPLGTADADIDRAKFDFSSDERFWHTAIATVHLDGARAVAVHLKPLVLRRTKALLERGLPMSASGTEGRHILERITRLSLEWDASFEVTDTDARWAGTRQLMADHGGVERGDE